LYYLDNHRTPSQLDDMRRLEADGVCIFCPDSGNESTERLIIHRTALWTVRRNMFPYPGTRLHLLLVPDQHVTDLADLAPDARADFWTALAWARDTHALTHYGLVTRNGLCEFTGGTIRHVHVHIAQGDVDDPEHPGVRVKVSSRPRSRPSAD
jgi:diadenosine tetraphosphate (Ap4A) HIT family hydrolase